MAPEDDTATERYSMSLWSFNDFGPVDHWTIGPTMTKPYLARQKCACKADELGAMKGWIDDVPVPNSNVKFATVVAPTAADHLLTF